MPFNGNKLKLLREAKGLTQIELGMILGKSTKYVSHLEIGWRLPSLPMLEELAKILDCELKDLVK